jgi:predicted DNA-binding transcriptional regulator YafY
VAIAVGLGTVAGQAVRGVDEAAVRAAAKLAQVLPAKLRRQVSTLTAGTLPFALPPATGVVPAGSLVTVASASAGDSGTAATTALKTARHVEPVRLVASGRRWYLLAFDLDRDDWRTFRVDRTIDLRATGVRAQHRSPRRQTWRSSCVPR